MAVDNTIKPRRSSTPGKIPTTADLADGEIAVDTMDRKIYIRDGSAVLDLGSTVRGTLSSGYANSTTTLGTVTDGVNPWTVLVDAGKSYRFEVIGTYQTDAATTGATMAVIPDGTAAGTIVGVARGAVTQINTASGLEASISRIGLGVRDRITTSGVSAAGVGHYIGMDFVFNCTTSGALSIQFASEVGGSTATLEAGSTLLVHMLP